MKNTKFFLSILLLFSIITLLPVVSLSQHIKCQVRVINTKLPQEKRFEVQELDNKLKDYVENYKWIEDEKFDKIINIAMQVFLDKIVFTFENQFTANIIIFASDGSYYGDKYCVFPYSQTDILQHQDFQFVPLTGLIDYFVYSLLGNEFDKVSLYGGTPYYKKATAAANSGNYSRYNKWWDRRLKKIEDILEESHNTFREMIFNFEQSYNYLQNKENDIAIEFLTLTLDFLTELGDNSSEGDFLSQFYEKNHKRLAEVANLESDRTFIEMLAELDEERADFYRDYK